MRVGTHAARRAAFEGSKRVAPVTARPRTAAKQASCHDDAASRTDLSVMDSWGTFAAFNGQAGSVIAGGRAFRRSDLGNGLRGALAVHHFEKHQATAVAAHRRGFGDLGRGVFATLHNHIGLEREYGAVGGI